MTRSETALIGSLATMGVARFPDNWTEVYLKDLGLEGCVSLATLDTEESHENFTVGYVES